jgi:hypothetical protein
MFPRPTQLLEESSMPAMTDVEFRAIDWRTLAENQYETYIEGDEVNGMSLTPRQITAAKRAHAFVGGDLNRIGNICRRRLAWRSRSTARLNISRSRTLINL